MAVPSKFFRNSEQSVPEIKICSYNCSHKFSGLALIFNQCKFQKWDSRPGSEKDTKDWEKVLKKLNFIVIVCTNLTTAQISLVLDDVAKLDYSMYSSLFVTMMSHGGENGKICTYDGELFVRQLYEKFEGENCRTLIGKPKLFFIQACRGTLTDSGVIYQPNDVDSGGASMIKSKDMNASAEMPSSADLLVMYSSFEGYVSYRHEINGSPFIQALCKAFNKLFYEVDMLTILTSVSNAVALSNNSGDKQMPVIRSTFTKMLKFTRKNNKHIRDSVASDD